MVLARAGDLLDAYRQHATDVYNAVVAAIRTAFDPDKSIYSEIPGQPFDKAVLERSDKVAVIPCDLGWQDIGSWQSLWSAAPKDENGNAFNGDAICLESRNCLVFGEKKQIVCAGVENLVIVERDGVLLIADHRNAKALSALHAFAANQPNSVQKRL